MTQYSSLLYDILSAGVLILSGIVSLIFLLYWRKSRDKFFAIFALAFAVFGIERLVLIAIGSTAEFSPYIYLIRLTAFLLIIAAIVQKNRAGTKLGS